MSKLQKFDELRPSFLAFAVGGLRRLAEAAYDEAAEDIRRKISDDGSESVYIAAGSAQAEEDKKLPFSHGHLPLKAAGTPFDLSRSCPFRLTVTFSDETLDQVVLELMMLNPRFMLDKSHFIPAEIKEDWAFRPLQDAAAPVGLVTQADPGLSPDARYEIMKPEVPVPVPDGFQDFGPGTLLSRADFVMTWKGGKSTGQQTDIFGKVFGKPEFLVPYGVGGLELNLASPDREKPFDALLYASGGFGIHLPSKDSGGKAVRPTLVYGAPVKDKSKDKKTEIAPKDDLGALKLYETALAEFGLSKDFTGLLFPGMEIHWLGEDGKGHDIRPAGSFKLGMGLTAISFGEGTALGRKAGWFTSLHATITPKSENSYLRRLEEITLRANIADGAPAAISLTGKFRDLDWPFEWMNGRRLRLSMIRQRYKNKKGEASTHMLIDSAIEGDGAKALANIKLENDMSRRVATGMILGPIIRSTGSINVKGESKAPTGEERLYFTNVSSLEALTAAAIVDSLGWFFQKDAVRMKEIRVVGARIQVQPASLNGAEKQNGSDVALLFDYEAVFGLSLAEAKLKSTRDLTARIDGSGLAFDGRSAPRWVQVPAGVRALSLADPGLWNIGVLEKILKITEVTLRREPRRELRITLRLDGNFGIATAGDFVLSVDLENCDGLRLESFPSKLTLEIPNALKAQGILLIDKSSAKAGAPDTPAAKQVAGKEGSDIAGSLDVTILPLGLRAYAGARVADAKGAGDKSARALLASLKVRLPTKIPLASSGIGIRGFEGLYAAHFERNEEESSPAVPKSLKWLEKINGEVATSLTHHPDRWAARYDQWAFGLGVELEAQVSSNLVNLNTMLLIERPGPVVTLFAKARLFEKSKSNQDAASQKELQTGILGIIQYDAEEKRFLLAALADIRFRSYVHFRAPISLEASTRKFSQWHLYLGTAKDRVTGTLGISGLVSVGVSGYLMLAGDELTDLSGPASRLPGFALALGVVHYSQIGSGSLYLRAECENYLALSVGEGLFAQGMIRVSGELRLFIVSIGVRSQLEFSYHSSYQGSARLYIDGRVCGRVKLFALKLSGCIPISIGQKPADDTKFPPLVEGLEILSGTNVALHGQGALGGIDAVSKVIVATNATNGEGAGAGEATGADGVALDAVLSVSLFTAPEINPDGLPKGLPPPGRTETTFNMGARSGHYRLKAIGLSWCSDGSNDWQDVDVTGLPAAWWPSSQSPAGGQALPRQLALMTRDPLAAKNVMVSEEELEAWIASITEGICKEPEEPQACVYSWTVADASEGAAEKWTLPGLLRSPEMAVKIGLLSATPVMVELLARPGAGSAADPVPGLPAILGGCYVLKNSAGLPATPMLRVITRGVRTLDYNIARVTSPARFSDRISPSRPLQMLIAIDQDGTSFTSRIRCSLRTAGGQQSDIMLDDAHFTLLELLGSPSSMGSFHEESESWAPIADAFAGLGYTPGFVGWQFFRLDVHLSELVAPEDHVTGFEIHLDSEEENMTLCIGALKYLPQAEIERFNADTAHRTAMTNALTTYLTQSEAPPLLEPKATYRLRLDWESDGDGAGPDNRNYEFRTTEHPPVSALPHLLSQHPAPGEKFHYWADQPGFGLVSMDLFRMLAKFPRARLRVRISDDAGNPVTSEDGEIDWVSGHNIDPKEVIKPETNPSGIRRETISSLPSALQAALLKSMKSGSLSCLGEHTLPDNGVWIGFDVVLRPLASYSIDIAVVDVDDKPWPFPEKMKELTGDSSLLSWRFSTGLYSGLEDFVAELGRCSVRNRILDAVPDFALSSPDPDPDPDPDRDGVRIMADKDLEDALADVGGERLRHGKQPEITLYWIRQPTGVGQEEELVPRAFSLTCPEPILRKTSSCKITSQRVGERSIRLAERAQLAFQEVNQKETKGIGTIYLGSGGFGLVAMLSPNAATGCALAFGQTAVAYVPRAVAPVQSLVFDHERLNPRSASLT